MTDAVAVALRIGDALAATVRAAAAVGASPAGVAEAVTAAAEALAAVARPARPWSTRKAARTRRSSAP